MCTNPGIIWVEREGWNEKVVVACRKCPQCRRARRDDFVGRCLAESTKCERMVTVTLTYAPRRGLDAHKVEKRDFQLFLKRLRRAGHSIRYLVVGEYGEAEGRMHFHAILFFHKLVKRVFTDPVTGEVITRGQFPRYVKDYPHGTEQVDWAPFCDEIPQKRMVHIREWPHGHITCDWAGDERAIRYVCKYLMLESKKLGWFSVSKKPTLGAHWFAEKAIRARGLGVFPSTFKYLPPGGRTDREYTMTGATRRDYLLQITDQDGDTSRMTEWCEKGYVKNEKYLKDRRQAATPLPEKVASFEKELQRKARGREAATRVLLEKGSICRALSSDFPLALVRRAALFFPLSVFRDMACEVGHVALKAWIGKDCARRPMLPIEWRRYKRESDYEVAYVERNGETSGEALRRAVVGKSRVGLDATGSGQVQRVASSGRGSARDFGFEGSDWSNVYVGQGFI